MIDLRIASARRGVLLEAEATYAENLDAETIASLQLRKFNEQWRRCTTASPFYKHWAQRHQLPSEIKDLREIHDFPVLTKSVLREHNELVFEGADPARAYETGGTTSEPTRFPAAKNEGAKRFADNYVGRLWWDIAPYERSALVWGHSHLYGRGVKRYWRKVSRATKDHIGGVLRLDGYQQSLSESQAHLRRILQYRPTHIIGYTSALVRIAHASSGHLKELRDLDLKGIICTADTLDEADEQLLSRTFGCPIIVEYGAAETGVIAVSRRETRNIHVLWSSHLVLVSPINDVYLSTLNPRIFPLINYSLGDRVKVKSISSQGSVLALSAIEGRKDDILKIRASSGVLVVGVLQMTHILKGHSAVESAQYSQEVDNSVTVHVRLSDAKLLSEVRQHLQKRVKSEYPEIDLSSLRIVYEPNQMHSKAGKHLTIRPSADNAPRADE